MLNYEKYIKSFIGALYLFGWLGLTWSDSRTLFMEATPWTLLAGGAILFFFHQQESRYYPGIYLFVIIISFAVECIGVESGAVFGSYRYGESLGIKLLDTPLIIGINWLMLLYMVYGLVQQWNLSPWLQGLGGASIMVGYDLLLEPVAGKLDFWYWSGGSIPLQNYLVWWGLSFIIIMLWKQMKLQYKNRMAMPLFIAQVLFFAALNITL